MSFFIWIFAFLCLIALKCQSSWNSCFPTVIISSLTYRFSWSRQHLSSLCKYLQLSFLSLLSSVCLVSLSSCAAVRKSSRQRNAVLVHKKKHHMATISRHTAQLCRCVHAADLQNERVEASREVAEWRKPEVSFPAELQLWLTRWEQDSVGKMTLQLKLQHPYSFRGTAA